MRILFLSDDFPPNAKGGAGIIAARLAIGLKNSGNEVFVITCGAIEKEYDYQGLSVFQIISTTNKSMVINNPKAEENALEIIKRLKPEIIHFHNVNNQLSYDLILKTKKVTNAFCFHTLHGTPAIAYGRIMAKDVCSDLINCPGPYNFKISIFKLWKMSKFKKKPFARFKIKKALLVLDKMFAVSQQVKKAFEDNGIKNIEVIHNGINADDFGELPNKESMQRKFGIINRQVILFAGRISGSKGLDQILKVLKIIYHRGRNPVLLIAGADESSKNDIKKLTDLLNLDFESTIKTFGWSDDLAMKEYLSAADMVVVPSVYFDPFPTINLEAMAAKKPVVGTIFGGTPEVVEDGVTGFLVNPFNIERMAEKIIYLLENPEIAKKMGQAGQERIRSSFSIEKQVKQTLFWYDKFLN